MASNIENVRAWLRECPLLDNTNAFRVDYIDDDPTCYAIFSSPSELKFKRDILGGVYLDSIQTINFYFGVSCPYGADTSQNMANVAALEDLMAWIYTQNIIRKFPIIEEGEVLSIMPTLTPYPMNIEANAAQYRISIQMKYRRY